MIRRRKHRGQRRPGLFAWQGDTTVADDQADNPRTRACKWCHAGIGNPCTRAGGIPIRDYHDIRKNPQENQ
ncbi:MAG TPA: hypothetical protein VGX25_04095 [Actinophytocola sp.]|uniref:zinc finger domain-containing protein n=1 Tax=Actinophytocola sp. TaxID=1872138 RepID=UPI002DDDAE9F|nr:hypothetical protein [Actinophytocola sp.]HEV2778560.1 hypothetical protein [Actinophytocola sp.]